MNISDLYSRCPVLFHMAEPGSWPGIVTRGLLSTSALLDLYQVDGARREAIESKRRPEKVKVSLQGLDDAIIRDQKPLNDVALAACLNGGLTTRDWYRLINRKVFFWTERTRLMWLMGANAYVGDEHLVITVETEPLVSSCGDRVTLSAINSGSTYVRKSNNEVAPRGPKTFQTISKFSPGDPVVELAVEERVDDIRRFARRADIMLCPRRDAEPELVREVWFRE